MMVTGASSGPVAAALHRWQVRPTLERIFDYRQAQFRRLFGGPAAAPAATESLYLKEY